tara:strand:+ start:1462 stop:2313 length:852 start_codon:yes stop_codon:yes gene_type:complete
MKKFVFVADYFSNQVKGGAEFTTDSIIQFNSGNEIVKINCQSVTPEIINRYKDYHWIVGNFSLLNDKLKINFCKNLSYSLIEYDYKFCKYRSIMKHKAIEGRDCDCVQTLEGKINSAFYGYAEKIWFMSENQREVFLSFVSTIKSDKTEVLSSIFSSGDLRFMNSIKDNEKGDNFLILGSDSWIKGTKECIVFAEENNLSYEVISGMPYHELLIKMSTSRGLIFRPLGLDTCPRIVIEAKLLGCELILNDNVQHKDEEWFSGNTEECLSYLQSRPKTFWNYYE